MNALSNVAPWGRIANHYARIAKDFFRAYGETALAFIPVRESGHGTDIACGPGILTTLAAACSHTGQLENHGRTFV